MANPIGKKFLEYSQVDQVSPEDVFIMIDASDLNQSPEGSTKHVLASQLKSFVEASTGLEAIDEGNGKGWRLIGQDPNRYGNIGLNAIDLGTNYLVGNYGATGTLSFVTGENNASTGYASSTFGENSLNLGPYSLITGSYNTNNTYSTLINGYENESAGGSSRGYNFITGRGNRIIGGFAQNLIGSGLVRNATSAIGTVVLGAANEDVNTSAGLMSPLTPMIIVGNGTHNTTPTGDWHTSAVRSNLLVGLRNGEVTLPSTTIDKIDAELTGKQLITKEWILDKLGTTIIEYTQIIELGEIGNSKIEDAFNAHTFTGSENPVLSISEGYVLVNTLVSGVIVQYLFVGDGGEYGTTGDVIAIPDDFAMLNKENTVSKLFNVVNSQGVDTGVIANGYTQPIKHGGILGANVFRVDDASEGGVIRNRRFGHLQISGNTELDLTYSNPNNGQVNIIHNSPINDYDADRYRYNLRASRDYSSSLPYTGQARKSLVGVSVSDKVKLTDAINTTRMDYIALHINPNLLAGNEMHKVRAIVSENGNVEFNNGTLKLGSYGSSMGTDSAATHNLSVDKDGRVIKTLLFGNVEAIPASEIAQIIKLGNIGNSTIESGFNAHVFKPNETPVLHISEGYVIVEAKMNGLDAKYLFIGEGGVYGSGGTMIATELDFSILESEDAKDNLFNIQAGSFTDSGARASLINQNIIHNGSMKVNKLIVDSGYGSSGGGNYHKGGITNQGFGGLSVVGTTSLSLMGGNPNNSTVRVTSTGQVNTESGGSTKATLYVGRLYNNGLSTSLTKYRGLVLDDTVDLSNKTNCNYIAFHINPTIGNMSGSGNTWHSIISERGNIDFRNGLLKLSSYNSTMTESTAVSALGVDASGNVVKTSLGGGGGGGNKHIILDGSTPLPSRTNLLFSGYLKVADHSPTDRTIISFDDSTFVRTVGNQTIDGGKTFRFPGTNSRFVTLSDPSGNSGVNVRVGNNDIGVRAVSTGNAVAFESRAAVGNPNVIHFRAFEHGGPEVFKISNNGAVKARSLNLTNLPTSSTGLVAGDVWNDGGILKIV